MLIIYVHNICHTLVAIAHAGVVENIYLNEQRTPMLKIKKNDFKLDS